MLGLDQAVFLFFFLQNFISVVRTLLTYNANICKAFTCLKNVKGVLRSLCGSRRYLHMLCGSRRYLRMLSTLLIVRCTSHKVLRRSALDTKANSSSKFCMSVCMNYMYFEFLYCHCVTMCRFSDCCLCVNIDWMFGTVMDHHAWLISGVYQLNDYIFHVIFFYPYSRTFHFLFLFFSITSKKHTTTHIHTSASS